jgi:hypothetical protein
MTWLLEPDMAGYRPYYAGHVCLRWNSAHTGKAKLATVNINYMKAAPGGPSKQFLLHYSCPK